MSERRTDALQRWAGWGYDTSGPGICCTRCGRVFLMRKGIGRAAFDEMLDGHRIECFPRPALTVFFISTDHELMAACTSMVALEAEAHLNQQRHDGALWRYFRAGMFAGGEPNGVACGRWPDTHRHFLYQRATR